jgi:hypothetical protein
MINRILLSLAIAVLSTSSFAQSFSVDMNSTFASPPLGGGIPDPSFGGAAGVPGVWNRISAADFGTNLLLGLDGNLTTVSLIGPSGGGGAGAFIQQNTGNWAALLNDAREVGIAGSVLNFRIEGLTNGTYRLFSYVASINLPYSTNLAKVSVVQASTAPQFTSGDMPGNQFVQGVTHTVHDLIVTNGTVNVSIETMVYGSYFNGLQLVAVPEPSTLAICILACVSFWKLRRNS